MTNIEHYLEVAEEEGANIILGVLDKTAGIVTFNINEFEAYTARILADKEAEIRQLTNDCNFLHEKNLRLNKQLSEAHDKEVERRGAVKALTEALNVMNSSADWELYIPVITRMLDELRAANNGGAE